MAKIIRWLNEKLAPSISIHGVLVDVFAADMVLQPIWVVKQVLQMLILMVGLWALFLHLYPVVGSEAKNVIFILIR